LRCLKSLRDDVVHEGRRTQGITLFVCTKNTEVDGEQVREGDTLGKMNHENVYKKARVDHMFHISTKKLSECFKQKERSAWTTEDIAEFVVLPATLLKKCFFTDLIDEKEVGNVYDGSFVSQARKCNFDGLVSTIAEHVDENHFIWLDVFSANQPLLTDLDKSIDNKEKQRRYDLLKFGLHDAIERFSNRFIYFDSWCDPAPLQRTWCVWELYGCIKKKKDMKIIFAHAEHESFIDALLDDHAGIIEKLCDIKTENSQCFIEQEKKMIFDSIRHLDEGFVTLNSLILSHIRDWLARTAMAAVDEFRKSKDERLDSILIQAGLLYDSQGNPEVALRLYEECRLIREAVVGQDHPEYADVLNHMAIAYGSQGNNDDALRLYKKCRLIRKKLHGMGRADYASTLNNMANIYDKQRKYDKALLLFQECHEIRKNILGTDNRDYAATLNNMGNVYNAQGEYEVALRFFKECLLIRKKILGADHPEYATTLSNIATVFLAQRKYEDALELNEECRGIRKKILGTGHPDYVTTLNNIASVYDSQGKCMKALGLYGECRLIQEKALRIGDLDYARTLDHMAIIYRKEGKLEDALRLYEKCRTIRTNVKGTNHRDYAVMLNNMASIYYSQGKYDDSLRLYEESRLIGMQVFEIEDRHYYADTLSNIANVYYSQHKYEDSLRLFEECRLIQDEVLSQNHPEYERTIYRMGFVYASQGNYDDALQMFEGCLSILKQLHGTAHPSYIDVMGRIARIYMIKASKRMHGGCTKNVA